MSNVLVNLSGNLVEDPKLQYTESGRAVCNFTVASTDRILNKETNEWEDGNTIFLGCTAWNQMAENLSETLNKGDHVVVTGKMRADYWEDKEGNNRTTLVVDVAEVGASLRFATGVMTRVRVGDDKPVARGSSSRKRR